jgi:hypothetical protein
VLGADETVNTLIPLFAESTVVQPEKTPIRHNDKTQLGKSFYVICFFDFHLFTSNFNKQSINRCLSSCLFDHLNTA